ncbi:lysophospholipase L1-like esterase [Lewinella aquimaris]|uniref:Lysophospholipase L1-like esterase n=1 Tax=Neolewinella aquimaris TaxID=1835722 RepID=A0A840E4W1_9BACT|nr:rhamnogalacturonan acetylesterase [Neolewinella aquimaris]MBB4080674.1 lysophospholipase L1-like esterase [Neolewinella aquimaris]
MRPRIITIVLASLLLSACHRPPDGAPTVFLVGDSTMAEKRADRRPETGWGEMLSEFLDGPTIENHAQNGRSTKSFRAEGRWQTVLDGIAAGDYVFIQFGHNDSKTASSSYSTPEEFETNLIAFVKEVRERGGQPVLLTPVVRRKFNPDGVLQRTHGGYPAAVSRAASATATPLIDMTEKSRNLVATYGDPASRELYLWLSPGANENYPDGVEDDTHFSPKGGREMARLVADGIREVRLPLRHYLVRNALAE